MRPLPTIILIAMLILISTCYTFKVVIFHNINARIKHANAILSGQMDPPYQYRILKPLAGRILETLLTPLINNDRWRHALSYLLITFAAFMGSFSFFYLYLRKFFSHNASIIGLLFLQAVIPLSVTGYYMEGDFITLGFYASGLYLMVCNKDIYLPMVIGFATLNREQSVFFVLLYALYLFSRRQASGKKLMILVSCFVVWFAVVIGTRLYFGFKASHHTVSLHIAHNIDPGTLVKFIIPLWIAEVASSVALCLLAFPKSNLFLRLSFLGLILYTVLFFLTGNMWELAKFLPAFLVMIPMGLQVLAGEYIEKVSSPQNTAA